MPQVAKLKSYSYALCGKIKIIYSCLKWQHLNHILLPHVAKLNHEYATHDSCGKIKNPFFNLQSFSSVLP